MINNEARIRDWRLRAAELRAIADAMKDTVARRGLLTGASGYDALADEAEADAANQWPLWSPNARP